MNEEKKKNDEQVTNSNLLCGCMGQLGREVLTFWKRPEPDTKSTFVCYSKVCFLCLMFRRLALPACCLVLGVRFKPIMRFGLMV
jgi:hypothetical protein